MSRFNIGIDTGGTYTDAALIDVQSRTVVAAAKSITTHGDLSIGVSAALAEVLAAAGKDFDRGDVALVSVSTTLATNALVEGQGSPVAALLIGFDDAMTARTRISEAVPTARIVRIDGGHDHSGETITALEEQEVRNAVDTLRNRVAAWSVASLYSTRNAAHEHRAQQIIRELTGAPVTVSSDLSDELDAPRRALTATLNARIVSRIVALIAAVRQSLEREAIDARLMIVKGDGSLASAEVVSERPIETILSGPAASVIGARYLSGKDDFIVSDIGGTTTDIAIARNGWPDIKASGATVGAYRTLVKAVDMRTIGLGGDSEVRTDFSGHVSLATTRVVPVALLGARWPSVERHLAAVLQAGSGFRTACRFLLLPEGSDAELRAADLSEPESALLDQLGEEPLPWSQLVHRLSDEKAALQLAARGLLQIAGFTPSDAAHVLGLQTQWSATTARLACEAMGRGCRVITRNVADVDDDLATFAKSIIDAVVRKSCHLLVERLAGRTFASDDPLVAAVVSGNGRCGDLRVGLSPDIPIVAVGGPAAIYYREVGDRLSTTTLIPPHSAVANAIGAATGVIRVQQSIEISAHEDGGFTLHLPNVPRHIKSADEALRQASRVASEQAEQRAREMGAVTVELTLDVQRVDIPDTIDDQGLIAATVTAECIGTLI